MDAIISKYKRIKLKDRTSRDEHRLVIEKQIGRKLTFNEIVHHKNENKGDNDPENLEIKSRSEHSRMHMKIIRKEGTPNIVCRKLLNKQILKIRELHESGLGSLKISRLYPVSRKCIQLILRGLTYKNVV